MLASIIRSSPCNLDPKSKQCQLRVCWFQAVYVKNIYHWTSRFLASVSSRSSRHQHKGREGNMDVWKMRHGIMVKAEKSLRQLTEPHLVVRNLPSTWRAILHGEVLCRSMSRDPPYTFTDATSCRCPNTALPLTRLRVSAAYETSSSICTTVFRSQLIRYVSLGTGVRYRACTRRPS